MFRKRSARSNLSLCHLNLLKQFITIILKYLMDVLFLDSHKYGPDAEVNNENCCSI